MGIFDESERGKTKVRQARSRDRKVRRSWPLSARLLVGAMFIFNVLLAAFLVRTEMKRPEAPAVSPAIAHEQAKAGSSPQLNAAPEQGVSLDQGSIPELRAPAVEVEPAGLPSTRRTKRHSIKTLPKALRASKTARPVPSAPMSRAVIYPPKEPVGQTSAPVRNAGATLGTGANVAHPGLVAPTPIAGVSGKAGTPANAAIASALSPSAIGRSLAAKGTGTGSTMKVASVGLPTLEKGLLKPKRPVAPTPLKIEIVPRPVKKVENCGDEKVFVACPELKTRYDTPFTYEDH